MQKSQEIKIALVHDFLIQYGGAERVLEVLCEIFPRAPIYTILYDKEKMCGKFADREIRVSFFGRFPKFLRKRFKWFLPLLAVAPETFDLREYDLVISSSSAWSKGIVTRLDTIHIAYIHSPMRFVWDYNEKYLREERREKLGFLVRPVLSYFRLWDRLAADRPEFLIANSQYTQKRIRKYYGRESSVIYPPVSAFSSKFPRCGQDNNTDRKYFLIISRLSAYKKIDIAIKAFNKLGLPLMIAGTGKEEKKLKKLAGPSVKFMGYVADEKLPEIYAGARAFIFPGVDDFGLAPAEAMMQGVPVIAFKKGGALEIVEEGKTGEFFVSQTPEAISAAAENFCRKEKEYSVACIKQSAEKFGVERFKKEILDFINGNT